MKILKYTGILLLAILLSIGLLIVYASITYYNPPQRLLLSESTSPDTIKFDKEYLVLSWNIGYAGLGDNMDFFYDSGKKVRDTKERTYINLDSIAQFIQRKSNYPFILIQEVDLGSKRSYDINEQEVITKNLKHLSSLGINYLVKFVPIPISSPLGHVNSGVMSLTNYRPSSSSRFAYPEEFGWPTKLFNLRRCMLVNRYPTPNGKEFILVNTHNSAFDDGSLKKQEMQFLKEFVLDEYSRGNYVLVGGDWNQSPPSFKLSTFGENYKVDFFKLTNVSDDFMPFGWKWVYDQTQPTNRYLNEIYSQEKTYKTIIDFFLISPNIEALDNQTFNLNFRNSDHNPISLKFMLKRL